MNRITHYYPILILFLTAALYGDEGLEPKTPEELLFIHRDTHYMRGQEYEVWVKQLAETPNITPKLYDLLWQYLEVRNETAIGEILFALRQRTDLDTAQLTRITDKMRSFATDSIKDRPMEERSFLWTGVLLLEKYPSPEHEDLALMLLGKDDSILRTNAVIALGKIGTKKSIEPVRKFIDRFRDSKEPRTKRTQQVLDAERELLSRATSGAVTPHENTSTPSSGSQKKIEKIESIKGVLQSTASHERKWAGGLLVGIIATGGAVWLLLKKWK